MDPIALRVAALVGVVLLAVAFGLVRRSRDGRAVDHAGAPLHVSPTDVGAPLGRHATLLQISSAFCTPCRAARRVLQDVAQATPGVAHVEIDVAEHLDLVRRLDVLRTPTILVLDGDGRVARRAHGVPSPEQVRAALTGARLVDGTGATA